MVDMKILDGFEVLYLSDKKECKNGTIVLVQYIKKERDAQYKIDGSGKETYMAGNGHLHYLAYTDPIYGIIIITLPNGRQEERKRLFAAPRSQNYTIQNGAYYDSPVTTFATKHERTNLFRILPCTYFIKVKAFCRKKGCDDFFLSECTFAMNRDVDGHAYFIETDNNIIVKN